MISGPGQSVRLRVCVKSGRRQCTTRVRAGSSSNQQNPRPFDNPAPILLPGGTLWLGLRGSPNASLVPVYGSNELTVYRSAQANQPTETGIVWLNSNSDIEDNNDETASARYPHRHHRRRTSRVSFTCDLCKTRNERRPVNPAAFRSGSVFVKCSGCASTHLIVDNLEIFHDTYDVFPPEELRDKEWHAELTARIDELRRTEGE